MQASLLRFFLLLGVALWLTACNSTGSQVDASSNKDAATTSKDFCPPGVTCIGEDQIATVVPYTHPDIKKLQATKAKLRAGGTGGASSEFLTSVTYGNGLYITVGSNGTIKSSTDGTNWIPEVAPTTDHLTGVTYGYDRHGTALFTTVGLGGQIFNSTDGNNWSPEQSNTTQDLRGITYAVESSGSKTFVAVGNAGTIISARSADKIGGWKIRNSTTTIPLFAVTYGNGTFVAVGANGTILTSPDSITWTPQPSDTSSSLYAVSYSGSTNSFTAVGADGTIVTSNGDGVTWKKQPSGVTYNLTGIVYSAGKFFVTGETTGQILSMSYDPASEASSILQITGSYDYLYAVAAAGSQIVTVGSNGDIAPSSPSFMFTQNTNSAISTLNLHDAVFVSGTSFLLVGANGIYQYDILSDAISATPVYSGNFSSIAKNTSGTYVAVGKSGNVVYSADDGTTWHNATTGGITNDLTSVSYSANSGFAAVGNDAILTSSDGISWNKVARTAIQNQCNYEDPNIRNLLSITNNGTYFAAVGGAIAGTPFASVNFYSTLTPPSTLSWECTFNYIPANPNSIFYDGMSQFVLLGNDGAINTSSLGYYDSATGNGNWATTASSTTENLKKGTYFNGEDIVVGDNGTILTSNDSITWKASKVSGGTPQNLTGIACGGNNYCVATSTSGIATSMNAGSPTSF